MVLRGRKTGPSACAQIGIRANTQVRSMHMRVRTIGCNPVRLAKLPVNVGQMLRKIMHVYCSRDGVHAARGDAKLVH